MRQPLTRFGLRPTLNDRSAYTLIEMLIASVLVAALMSVVWSMMSMYNGYLRAGQLQAVEQQLIRSVLHLLEIDLQGVAIADTNPTVVWAADLNINSSVEALGEPRSQTDPFSVNVDELSLFSDTLTSSSGSPPGRISLIGNSHSVRLSIEEVPTAFSPFASISANPSGQIPSGSGIDSLSQTVANNPMPSANDIDAPAIEGVAPDVPEFKTIIWQFQAFGEAASGSTSLRSGLYRIQSESLSLQAARLQQETLIEDRVQSDETSVDRMTLEALLYPPVDNRRETKPMATNEPEGGMSIPLFDVIPEVVGCRFEYFSGSAWTSSWNSELQQGLPLAIRIRLRFVTPADLEKLNLVLGTTQTADSPLDRAMNGGADTVSSLPSTLPSALDDPAADPFVSIPTRQIQRIVILQPLTGPMPKPGAIDETDALPMSDDPAQLESLL